VIQVIEAQEEPLAKRSRSKSRPDESDRLLFDNPAPDTNGNGTTVALHEATRSRYLNYALSVITSRALPDVRDGLKPVQRRILYTMWQQRVTFDAKHRKCAGVVGAVMQHYHPHGDSAIYEALVRMAQPFSLRYPLVDGSGNFGSLDGDAPAAMRYTECRLARIADEMLAEAHLDTVHQRPNYDGSKNEPVVLPARMPNLLLNGATGIAVGMATNIPPHNLGEVCKALLALLKDPELKTHQLCRYIKGPDFPTGGQILNTADELREIYKTGSGAVRIRATTLKGPIKGGSRFIDVTSIPYGVNKALLVECIGEIITTRKLPQLLNVKDLSTDDVRVELELKKDADHRKILAYLFKNTALQTNFNVNLTCLTPTENPLLGRPERCELRAVLLHFINFRIEVVTRRLEHELAQLKKRIHILEGFASVFDALDEIIRIIRSSDGKQDAAQKIIKKFKLDAEQTEAILELKLYRLARLEIRIIQEELQQKQRKARQITILLENEQGLRDQVGKEIDQVRKAHDGTDKRRTTIEAVEDEPQYSADDFIVDEDNHVLVTRDGWVKRQKEIRDPAATRLREGDEPLTLLAGSTRATCVFFTSFGTAYTCYITDIPATTGYGEPVQKIFKLKDGEKVVAAVSLDRRAIGNVKLDPKKPDKPPPRHGLAVTSDGYSLRFGIESFLEPSTRSGRRFARPAKGATVTGIEVITGTETVIAATAGAHAILCPAGQIKFLAGAGRGVQLLRVAKDDRVIGFCASRGDRDLLEVITVKGNKKTISTAKYETTTRGGKGRQILMRGSLVRVVPRKIEVVVLGGK
jgi:DNA gyrase subunit A